MSELRKIPWWVPDSIEFVESIIQPHWRVLEFGCGGLTLWLANRCAQVVSIEHNPAWSARIKKIAPENVVLLERRMNYSGMTKKFKEDSFDLVCVDGRNRVDCMKGSKSLIKVNGWMLLDNADRAKYQPGIDLFATWPQAYFRTKHKTQNGPDRNWFTFLWQRQAYSM